MLFSPDELSGVAPSSLRQVHALAQRALVAGSASGQGLGVICVHLDGYAECVEREGHAQAEALLVRTLEHLPFGSAGFLCGHREAAQAIFYVQGLNGAGMRSLAQACSDGAGLSVGAAHSLGQQKGDVDLESVRLAAMRGARLALRTGGGRFAYIERFGAARTGAQTDKQAALPKETLPEFPAKFQAGPVVEPVFELQPQPAGSSYSHKPTEPTALPEQQEQPEQPKQTSAQGLLPDSTLQLKEMMRINELAWRGRVDRLERRLEKMGRLLESVGSGARGPSLVENGLASRFQAVQGLEENDSQFEAKSGLMSELFTANMKMRDRINERTAS